MIFRSQRWNSTVPWMYVNASNDENRTKRIGKKNNELIALNYWLWMSTMKQQHNNFSSTNWFGVALTCRGSLLPWLSLWVFFYWVFYVSLSLRSRERLSFWVVFEWLSYGQSRVAKKRVKESYGAFAGVWSVEPFHSSLIRWVTFVVFGAYQSTIHQPICCLKMALLWQSRLWINNCLAHINAQSELYLCTALY